MPYFRGEGLLTKKFVISLIKGKPKYLEYLPDNVRLENLSKDFLFSVSQYIIFQLVAYIEPNIYAQMYDMYKKKTVDNAMKKWDEYGVNISSDMVNDIKEFVPIKK